MNERSQILGDKYFWDSLEYIVSRWFSSSEAKELRSFWIDGFVPNSFRNTKRGIDVLGKAWIGKGPRNQDLFDAVISVPQKMLTRRREEYIIEDVSIDEQNKSIWVIVNVTT